MPYPKSIQNLIDKFSQLPSVGPKTAERYVFHLLKQAPARLQEWAESLSALSRDTKICQNCLDFSASDPCPICREQNRQSGLLCLVSSSQDLASLEATGQYRGRYFVLGGLIDTINGPGPEDLPLDKLAKKIKAEKIEEVIIALDFTLEGETTALYLNKMLKGHVKVTRLAKGLPAGSDLEYADETTLASALKNRNEIK